MTIITNAEKITAWQDANPLTRLTSWVLLDILALNTLEGADLSDMNLCYVDLSNTGLTGANLRGTKLNYANLFNSSGGVLTFRAGVSGEGYLKPTPDGWRLTIGCWEEKTLEDLDDLIHNRTTWPEAKGNERARRRPMLIAVKSLCEAWIGQQPDTIITDLNKKWNTK